MEYEESVAPWNQQVPLKTPWENTPRLAQPWMTKLGSSHRT